MDKRVVPFVAIALFTGCTTALDPRPDPEPIMTNEGWYVDDDGDGFDAYQDDCNDADASVHPGATEVCGDGVDNDCDGTVDNCAATTPDPVPVATNEGWYTDEDGDGSPRQDDCDDNNPDVHPNATEICDDKIDNDCDGTVDNCKGASLVPDWAAPVRTAQWRSDARPWTVQG